MCSRVLENDPVGSKILKRNVCVSDSEIKVEKEQSDHDDIERKKLCSYDIRYNCHLDFEGLQEKDVGKGMFPEKKAAVLLDRVQINLTLN